jgi:deoxyribodipyrimidine photo-lyase
MKRALIWFRGDLRVADNAALAEAMASGFEAVGVFTVCPEQWAEHDWAPVKVDLLLRSLSALAERLEALGVPLRVLHTPRFDGVPEALCSLAEELGAEAVYCNREYEWNERRRDRRVARRLAAEGRALRRFHDQVVLPPGEVRTKQGGWYTVFTPFKRAWLAALRERGLPVPAPVPKPQARPDVASDPVPDALPGFEGLQRPDLWKAGEGHAAERLRTFVAERGRAYADRRDLPGVGGTSTISPYLALGVLSPRQCLAAVAAEVDVLAGDADPGLDTWVSELVWREFYKQLLVGFPRVSKDRCFRADYERVPWLDDPSALEAWQRGRTGYPLVDAGMRQLAQTGWMHNRVRMVTASFLTKHLLIDWREGERFFMRNLVDGDLAANNGGWQWAASTGTDAQPYFRVFNPWLQSKRYDPEGVYVKLFVPELAEVPAKALHDPARLAKAVAELGLDYPAPVVEHRMARQRAIDAFAGLKAKA